VGFAIQSALRPRTEEAAQRAEPVLAARVSRNRFMWSHLGIALAGSTALLLVLGLGFGISAAISSDDAGELPRMIGAAIAYAPALWVFVGLAAALFGLAPRFAGAAWAVLGGIAFVGFLGPLLRLPDWVFEASPLEHVPRLPVADFDAAPELVLTVIAGVLVSVGSVAFRRRDLTGG
jgi:ABC-2 type transport system permease protein